MRSDFRSRELSGIINGCHVCRFEDGGYVGLPRRAEAVLSPQFRAWLDDEDKISYLAGAYVRYAAGPTLHVVENVELVGEFANELGCADVSLRRFNPGYVPGIVEVRFTPTETLARRLGIYEWPGRDRFEGLVHEDG